MASQADMTPLQKEFLELAMGALLKPRKEASKSTEELLKEQIDKRKKVCRKVQDM